MNCRDGSVPVPHSHWRTSRPVAPSRPLGLIIYVYFNGIAPNPQPLNQSMPPFTHHIFICTNRRESGHRRGCCDPEGTEALRSAFKSEIKRRQLGPLVRANKAGCLEQCEHGPTVAIYPQGVFYGNVTVADVPRIIEETVVGGRILEDLRIADTCLNNRNCEHIRCG
jgi:(2Fe-2S) ferredoxin